MSLFPYRMEKFRYEELVETGLGLISYPRKDCENIFIYNL